MDLSPAQKLVRTFFLLLRTLGAVLTAELRPQGPGRILFGNGAADSLPGQPAGRTFSAERYGHRISHLLVLIGVLLAVLSGSQADAAPYGETISNTAYVDYQVSEVPQPQEPSNTVSYVVRSPAIIEFLKYSPRPESNALPVPVADTYYQDNGTFILIPVADEATGSDVPLLGAPIYYPGELIYLSLTDLDQNLDPTQIETVIVTISCTETGDTEVLLLSETGPDAGVFTGYIPSLASGSAVVDGSLLVQNNCELQVHYVDVADNTDTTADAALIDPYGYVYDSTTGEPLDGASVTLIDVATGQPAQVFGNDTLSTYPATVITGGTVTDTGGEEYQLPTGGFRFPYLLPGTYRLEIIPPDGYAAPSDASEAQLLASSWWPSSGYTTALGWENGQWVGTFTINPGPAVRIDIPVDPASTELWLKKDASNDSVSIGDFLQYRLTLENNSSKAKAPAVTITDTLPIGFRYQSGSTKLDGESIEDPEISADVRTLIFQLGDLPAGETIELRYVVEITAGAKAGTAINQAQAADGYDGHSNIAKKSVRVEKVFFNDKLILAGRVLTGSCEQEDTELPGLPGVRIFLEDGSFVVTDDHGKYHFEGVDPGTHVVQIDLPTLPPGYVMIPCEDSSQSAGRNFSRFVDLKGGTLWRVNFHTTTLPPPTGEVSLQLFSTLEESTATLRATVNAAAVPIENLRLMIMLPGSSTYLPGTTRQDGAALADPELMSDTVILRTPQLTAGQSTEFTFQAQLSTVGNDGELPAKALLTFDSPAARNQRTPVAVNLFNRTPGNVKATEEITLYPHFPTLVADLQAEDQLMLEQLAERLKGQQIERIEVVGHADSQRIAPANRRLFADNLELSRARARSIAEFLQQQLDVAGERITVRGMGDTLPLADNGSSAGRALNRRVELNVVTSTAAAPQQLELKDGASAPQAVATTGADPAAAPVKALKVTEPVMTSPPEADPKWLATLAPESGIVWPPVNYNLDNPSTTVMVQHPADSTVQLLINGRPANVLNFIGKKSLLDSDFAVSRWEGLGVQEGRNIIEAVISGTGTTQPLTRELWFVTNAEKLVYDEARSNLLADGITPPAIALRVTDRDGHPVFQGRQLEYRVSPPYQALYDQPNEDTRPTAKAGHLVVGADGIAYAQLQPTPQAGQATITVQLPDGPHETSVWLKPVPREWVMVGFAEGTIGFNTLSGNRANLDEAGIDDHYYQDGQVKFFAKGAIKGEWLLTLAYDSHKPKLDGDSLKQMIDPDTYYPLYGDATEQGYEAASARKLYVKLERSQFYALFGDMDTGLSQTVLSQYVRSMNGFKSELAGEHFAYTLFAAETKQAFFKDELRGDGTSGRYRLTQKDLVINSEEVFIETRDRFHAEQVLSQTPLARHSDYDIDYAAGTIYFKRPIASKDQELNPIYIVVRYETNASDKTRLNYGGRAAVKLLDQRVEVGASLIHDASGEVEGDLYGADVSIKLTPQTTVRTEVATSSVDDVTGTRKGEAYLAEVEHHDEKISGRAWFRQQESAFGLGQQNEGTGGLRTYGVEGGYSISDNWNLTGELWREDNLDSDAEREVGSLQTLYTLDPFSLMAGLRQARDSFDDGTKETSVQALGGVGWHSADQKIALHATHAQSLSSNENVDFPTRTTFGADYQLNPNLALFAEQEFTWGDERDTQGTRLGLKTTPWQGGEISSSIERQIEENGERLFAIFGLGQDWQLNERWTLDLALDRSYTIMNKPAGERVNSETPLASGADDDFTALSLGAAYHKEEWTWWNRLETRQSDSEDRYGISSGIVGKIDEGTAVSAKLTVFLTDTDDSKRNEEELTLGLAYRPDQSRWMLLDRLDLAYDSVAGADSRDEDLTIVNHLHANHRSGNRKWQSSLYYGLKYNRETFSGDSYSGFTDMVAAETRYNLTRRWDLGLHGAALHSWNSQLIDYSYGGDIGFMPMTNTWLSVGYNLAGFSDDDFSSANYTAQGLFLKVRVKFDQRSVKDALNWLQQD